MLYHRTLREIHTDQSSFAYALVKKKRGEKAFETAISVVQLRTWGRSACVVSRTPRVRKCTLPEPWYTSHNTIRVSHPLRRTPPCCHYVASSVMVAHERPLRLERPDGAHIEHDRHLASFCVVEDDPRVRALLHDVRTEEGYAVVAAISGEEALATLATVRPRL